MKSFLNRLLLLLVAFSLLISFPIPVRAENTGRQASEITNINLVTDHSGFPSLKYLFNNKYWETQKTEDKAHLTLESSKGIGSLYLSFMYPYGAYTVINNDSGAAYTAGLGGFIHEFIDLTVAFGSAPASVTISFENGPAHLHELDVFTEGQVPDHIEKWNTPPEGEIDLILFASHSDDDQLFFAGLLPYYAIERNYQVQVVYLTDHHNTAPGRVHEALRGLWAAGVRNYPVLGHFEDFGDAETAEDAFRNFAKYGHSREDLTGFVVEQLRRFCPMVVVGHDLKGEYGHPQHKAFAQMLIDAVAASGDPDQFPETAGAYGVWDVPKTYLHLYQENKIVMDWDQPMENYKGMTPYLVSKDLAFPFHVSQQKGWASYHQGHDTAASIKNYSPCKYGLYRSTVGLDEVKNDMFENVTCHAEQQPAAAETLPPETETPTEAPTVMATEAATELLPEETIPPTESAQTESRPLAPTDPLPTVPDPADGSREMKLPIGWIVLELTLILALAALLVLKRRKKAR